MKTYPISLNNLSAQNVVVIGGGKVALRKAQGLLEAGATITVISPEICQELVALSRSASLQLERRDYRVGDLRGVFLVIAATDNPQVNQKVWEEACREGCLINVVDDPARCNFIIPAQVRHGDFSVAISTGGASPALARRLREKLEVELGPEYGALTTLLGELRPVLLASFPPGEARLEAALRLIDSHLLDVIKQDGFEKAKCYALDQIMVGDIHE